jgi:hypothetical protein
MVCVLIVGTVLGFEVREARIQRDAVSAIMSHIGGILHPGRVYYNWELADGAPPSSAMPGSQPWAPKWLVDILGIDYFGHVVYVELPSQIQFAGDLMTQVGRRPASRK